MAINVKVSSRMARDANDILQPIGNREICNPAAAVVGGSDLSLRKSEIALIGAIDTPSPHKWPR
jgi:hypothetical protein